MAKVQNSTNLYGSNILIVDVNGNTPFTTIASAITAATSMGLTNPTIYIRAGTYTENLTLVNGVNLRGDDRYTCIIDGQHTVPAAGQIQISELKLAATVPATSVFIEGGAGTCAIDVIDCIFNVNSGMVFNLPTSTGPLSITGCSDISAANSIVDNTTGASVLNIRESSIGSGAVAAAIAGTTFFGGSRINCSVTLSGTASLTTYDTHIGGTLTQGGTSTVVMTNSDIVAGAAIALVVGAGCTASLGNVVINSTVGGGNCITGAGAITISEITFVSASGVTTTTQTYTTRISSGSVQLDKANTGNVYLNAGLLTPQALTDGQLQIGSTGAAPSAATITAGSGISVTNGAGSISIASTAPLTWAQVGADGALVVNQNTVNSKVALLTMSLPATAAINTVIGLVGWGAGGWTITQAANQQILFGNTNTTLGAGGSLSSSDKGDCVFMVCVTADLVWRVYDVIGNLTVV